MTAARRADPIAPAHPRLGEPALAPAPRAVDRDPDPLHSGLAAVLAAAERLVAGLGLVEVPLPAGLARLRGHVRGETVELRTRSFTGHVFEAIFIATISAGVGAPRSATVIALPAPGSLLPILGVDLIALGGALSLAAIDLAPVDDAAWSRDAEPLLLALHRRVEDRVIPRRWPAFAHRTFSRLALIGAGPRGDEAPLLSAAADLVDAYGDLARAPSEPPAPESALAAHRRRRAWQAAELDNRREHDALARLFGADAAARFLGLIFGGETTDAA